MQKRKESFTQRIIAAIFVILVAATPVLSGGCSGGSGDTQTTSDLTSAQMPEVSASSADLYCLEFNSFSGVFVEDGKNEKVSDIAAILVENRADVFLDRATITYKYAEKTATFVVTGLPAGEKCWVMEANKMKIDGNQSFEFLDCVSAFKEDAILSTDKISVATDDNALTVTNTSQEILKNICVYYKNTNDDGNYLGGITYMVAFDELAPGESLTKESGHFSDSSKIVRYSFQTQ